MSNVGFATLTIIPSAKGFASALSGETNPAMSRAGREGGGLFGKSLMPGIGTLAAAAGGLFAAVGVGGFFKDAVSGAAELEQSVGAIETVFKGSAPQMLSWAGDAATAVGLTKNQYSELGTLIGTQLRNGGTAMDELAPKTNDLIGLGADLSSMFGGTTADAVGALSSALKGERDPIEQYGVSLNQASIDAKAAELGFEKVSGALSSEASQAATLALIMDQTADAHGNFDRESDTLAHKQQVLNALWEDGKARIGGALVPAVSALTGTLISGLGPALDGAEKGITKVTEVVGGVYGILAKGAFTPFAGLQEDSAVVDVLFRIREGVQAAVEGIGGATAKVAPYLAPIGAVVGGLLLNLAPMLGIGARVATALAPIMATLTKLAPAARLLLGPFGLVVGAIGAIVASSPELRGQLMGLVTTVGSSLVPIFSTLGGAVAALGGAVAALAPVITTSLGMLGPIISGLLVTLAPALSSIVGLIGQVAAAVIPLVSGLLTALVPVLVQLVGAVLPPLVSIFGVVAAAIAPLVVQLVDALVPVLLSVVTAIMPVVTTIAGLLVPVIQNLMPVVTTVFGIIADVVGSVMQIISGIIQVVTGIISGNWSQVWSGIGQVLGGVWDLIKAVITGAVALVLSVITATLRNIATVWSGAWNGIKSFISGAWAGITGAVSAGITSVLSFFSGLGQKILGGIGDLGGLLTGVGRNMIEGLIGGVKAVAGKIKDAVLGPIKDSVEAVKGFLGIHSSSRLFIGIGEYTGQGMAIGLRNSAGLVADASDALLPTAPTSASHAAPRAGVLAFTGLRPGGGDTYITVNEATNGAATAQDVARRQARLGA